MNRRLIAAIHQIIGRLNAVVADLEDGRLENAAVELEQMQSDWASTMKDLQP